MALPIEPVTLTVAQISELAQKLSGFRHDVNNKLSIIAASLELIHRRPENAERLLNSLGEQPKKISEMIAQFSTELEAALNIKRS
jgi:hypothetical protein